jgi:hypothetical protein
LFEPRCDAATHAGALPDRHGCSYAIAMIEERPSKHPRTQSRPGVSLYASVESALGPRF